MKSFHKILLSFILSGFIAGISTQTIAASEYYANVAHDSLTCASYCKAKHGKDKSEFHTPPNDKNTWCVCK